MLLPHSLLFCLLQLDLHLKYLNIGLVVTPSIKNACPQFLHFLHLLSHLTYESPGFTLLLFQLPGIALGLNVLRALTYHPMYRSRTITSLLLIHVAIARKRRVLHFGQTEGTLTILFDHY